MRLLLAVGGRTHELVAAETIVGRATECDLVVEDKSVSRHHAAILLSEASARVRDLGSRNGTTVNGMEVGTARGSTGFFDRRLRAGDRIKFGNLEAVVGSLLGEDGDRDDGWLAMQAALLLKYGLAGQFRVADGMVFRIAESFEARHGLGERFGVDVTDAALAAVIDHATLRNRPGWTRWAMAMHAKLGLVPQSAVRRALDRGPHHPEDTQEVRTSGPVSKGAASARRNVG